VKLEPEQLVELAELVADALVARNVLAPSSSLLSPAELAHELGVTRSFVYAHKADLGAVRLSSGPRARLRFSLERAREGLTACSMGRGSSALEPARSAGSRPRRRRSLGTSAPLLPIRGSQETS
jgi:hypothetical protein